MADPHPPALSIQNHKKRVEDGEGRVEGGERGKGKGRGEREGWREGREREGGDETSYDLFFFDVVLIEYAFKL